MAKDKSTPSKQEPAIDVEKLQRTIEEMDALSQEALSHIGAIARLALMALKTPDGHRSTSTLAYALHLIWSEAGIAETNINAAADSVGCGHMDREHFRCESARAAFLSELGA